MKKRLLTLLLVSIVVLSGCGNKEQIDYTNPQVYIDEIVERANDLNENFLTTLGELVDVTGTQSEFNSVVDSYKDVFESIINKVPEQTENFYNEFDKKLQEYTGDLVDQTETLQGAIDTFNDSGEGVQELYSKTYKAVFNIMSNFLDKVSEFVDDATEDDLENLKDLSDYISEYEEKTGESFKDSIKEGVDSQDQE